MTGPVEGLWTSAPTPAMPPVQAPVPAEHVQAPLLLAEWNTRAKACTIDWIFSALLAFAVTLAAMTPAFFYGNKHSDLAVVIMAATLGVVAYLLYAPMLMKRSGPHNGQTWGKQLTGIRVIREDAAPMGVADAMKRQVLIIGVAYNVLTVVPVIGWAAVAASYLWPLKDLQSRAGHDYLCHTRVVVV
jgi:uncharacterized RDD family membrane protein YckC